MEHLRGRAGHVDPDHLELKINENLVELYHREEIMWRRRNLIRSLAAANGLMIDDSAELESMVTEFYKNLFCSEGVTDMEQVINTMPAKVTDVMNAMLTAPYNREEVKIALYQMFHLKAPGPAQFFQHTCVVRMLQVQFCA